MLGKIVHYFPKMADINMGMKAEISKPVAALVVHELEQGICNILAFDQAGERWPRFGVILADGDPAHPGQSAGGYASAIPSPADQGAEGAEAEQEAGSDAKAPKKPRKG